MASQGKLQRGVRPGLLLSVLSVLPFSGLLAAQSAPGLPEPQFFWLGEAPTRVRAVRWSPTGTPRGTLFLLPGRSSILGLRLPFLKPIVAEGWEVYTLDWRGQGESDRWLKDTRLIDIQHSFDEYVADALELVQRAEQEGAPRPYAAIGVSLGGHILLRSIEEGAPLQAAVLQVPLCDVRTGIWPARLARSFASIATKMGLGEWAAPGQPTIDIEAILRKVPDSPQRQAAAAYVAAHPETLTDTVTIRWADAMFRSIDKARSADQLASVRIPVLMVAATYDQICDSDACRQIADAIPSAEYAEVPGDHFFFTQAQVKLEGMQRQVRQFFQKHIPFQPKSDADSPVFLGA
jgi:lysophospholipase